MSTKTACLIGATGMTGKYLLNLLLEDDYYQTVRVIVRRPMEKISPKMEVKLVDFSDAESLKLALEGSDCIFCCIGTTQKNVKGDNELYRKIDFEIPVNAARLGRETGCEKMVLISSIGADKKSRTFYLKLKGEMEQAVISSKLPSIHIMQPSMLLGHRDEKRTGEWFLKGFMKIISFFLVGELKKLKAIHAHTLAKAMLNVSKSNGNGVFRYTYEGIKDKA